MNKNCTIQRSSIKPLVDLVKPKHDRHFRLNGDPNDNSYDFIMNGAEVHFRGIVLFL